ncbi:excinuclease Cho [Escherichia coli]|nr:excinuclease Cho [Escherichia coli]
MVRRLTSPRLEFEAAAIYEYPEHLRSFLNDLPTRPGVYLFHGESDTMPLYIGKSVNIRSRVLSHLRTPDEAAMLRQSDGSAGYVPPVKSALCSLKRD